MLYDVGRICVKTMGRETGSYCVVLEILEGSFVMVTGPKSISGVRRRKCNTRHLEPLETVLEIKEGADDDDVIKALEDAGLVELFREKIRLEE